MRKYLLCVLLCFAVVSCTAERLAPGPGPASPHFIDDGHWMAADGFVLGLSQWQAERPRAVVVALHGMNDYGNFIRDAAGYWRGQGITTYAYDQRGFGRTEGNGRWPGHDVMAEDVHSFIAIVRARHPGVPVWLLGESMGGAVAMLAASRDGAPVADGLVLVSPALWGWSNLDLPKRAALWTMMQLAPGSRLTARGLDVKPSDNERMLIALGQDPFVIKATRVDAVHGLTDLMEAAWQARAHVTLPTYVLYATGDEVVPARPIEDAARDMPGTRASIPYADGHHMLLRDLDAPRVWKQVETFILKP